MKKLLPLLLALAACNPADFAQPQPNELERQARSALACPAPSPLTWSTDLGTIDASGNFTSPGCPTPYADQTAHVSVSGCGNSTTIPIAVADALKALTIYCGVVSPATCCTAGNTFSVEPGARIQFYYAMTYSCAGHVLYGGTTPPALCP